MILDALPASQKCFADWADFAKACVERPGDVRSRGTTGVFVEAKTLKERQVDVGGLMEGWGFERVLTVMRKGRDRRVKGEEGEMKALPKL